MMELIVGILTLIMFIVITFLGACGMITAVKLGFIAMEYVDKITDKLKKKVRE